MKNLVKFDGLEATFQHNPDHTYSHAQIMEVTVPDECRRYLKIVRRFGRPSLVPGDARQVVAVEVVPGETPKSRLNHLIRRLHTARLDYDWARQHLKVMAPENNERLTAKLAQRLEKLEKARAAVDRAGRKIAVAQPDKTEISMKEMGL